MHRHGRNTTVRGEGGASMAAFWIAVLVAYVVVLGFIAGDAGWRMFHPHH